MIELYENTGARRQLTITGLSLTGAGPEPDAVTMTAVPTDVKEDSSRDAQPSDRSLRADPSRVPVACPMERRTTGNHGY